MSAPALEMDTLFDQLPTAYLVLSRDLVVLTANAALLRLTGRSLGELVGRPLFELFPPAPDRLEADGTNPLQTSFERVRDTGRAERLSVVHYDLPDASGALRRRYWSLVNAPVLDPGGRCVLLAQCVEDVTDYVLDRAAREGVEPPATGPAEVTTSRRSVEAVEADLVRRAEELRGALEAERTASRRLAGFAGAVLQLALADTVDDLVDKVLASGLAALAAEGGALALRDDARGVVRLTTSGYPGAAQRTVELPLDADVPAARAARTGELVVLGDRAAGLAWSPHMAELYATSGQEAWIALPLRVGDRVLGSIAASWAQPRTFGPEETGLLVAFAAQCAQALERLEVRLAEQQVATLVRQMSETLQRSLLTEPQQPEDLRIVVRYRPAAEQVQVGGDWYDAFRTRDGSTSLVVGDVAGHDRDAAALMGQVRNLLRGVAYTLPGPPSSVLGVVDAAMRDLEVGALATALLAKLEPVEEAGDDAAGGVSVLRWANAGHLPPLVLGADGAVRLLDDDPDLLLGLDPDSPRTDRRHVLHPGSTVLLYTDGLVERRGRSLDDGLAWLAAAAARLADLDPEDLCDALLAEVAGTAEDDIALLALSARPAGPARADATSAPGRSSVVVAFSERFAPDAAVLRTVRRLVTHHLELRGMGERALEGAIAVSELAANAVLHARTEFEVRVLDLPDGVRVEVHDGSSTMPLPGPLGAEAMSGRGLQLLEQATDRWGVDPRPGDGKTVWFEMRAQESALPDDDEASPTADQLVEMWARHDDPASERPGAPHRVLLRDVPVRELLAAKLHMEDLVRELKLVLIDERRMVRAEHVDPHVVHLARRLDAAVDEFSDGRLQLRSQAMLASAAGYERATLELSLLPEAASAAERYRDAVEEAEALGDTGELLAGGHELKRYSALRRWYLGEVISQLRGGVPSPGPGRSR
ncbi:serine phosphatase RsbU (regulator of sigma subunit) [Motilibacter peucedani]|uniref:Serine phosphatase RsbU (Regulator of sigma subunit) n=1 Tax=Motilibacter peucedani TaxID=598650 RepID=A0A420XLY3_9ACTN|nr:SpoIIE family protein phosphatase [Motilibacter peucedani]RKS71423.1 serine phosphatase RsbU (regulator of sigma subunit) [Motilibacter peucedani]